MVQGVRSARATGRSWRCSSDVRREFEGWSRRACRCTASARSAAGSCCNRCRSTSASRPSRSSWPRCSTGWSRSADNQRLFDFVWGFGGGTRRAGRGEPISTSGSDEPEPVSGLSPGNASCRGRGSTSARFVHAAAAATRRVLSADDARILHDLLECDVRHIAEIGLNRRQRWPISTPLLVYYGYHLDAIHAVQSVGILQEVF